MLQYLAQGACQALEDADYLSTLVAKQARPGRRRAGARWLRDRLGLGMESYRRKRSERTPRVQVTARWWGELWHCAGGAREARNALLRERSRTDYEHIDWLYAG